MNHNQIISSTCVRIMCFNKTLHFELLAIYIGSHIFYRLFPCYVFQLLMNFIGGHPKATRSFIVAIPGANTCLHSLTSDLMLSLNDIRVNGPTVLHVFWKSFDSDDVRSYIYIYYICPSTLTQTLPPTHTCARSQRTDRQNESMGSGMRASERASEGGLEKWIKRVCETHEKRE